MASPLSQAILHSQNLGVLHGTPQSRSWCSNRSARCLGTWFPQLVLAFAKMTSSSQAHLDIPERLWFLCPRAHTIITSRRLPMPPEARPKLNYILTFPFRRWATGFDQMVLASLLTSLSSKWEEQGPSNRNYTFSLRYTELSWQVWAELPSLNSRVRTTLMRWKSFAKKHRIEVLDGYEVDIRDVSIRPMGLDYSICPM